MKSAKKDWSEVRDLAMTFEPTIRKNWPAYLEEMEGQSPIFSKCLGRPANSIAQASPKALRSI